MLQFLILESSGIQEQVVLHFHEHIFHTLVGTFFLDYIFAFTVLGLSGMFRERGFVGKMLGVALTIFLRFVCHYISGVIIFDIWMPEEWSNVHLYSICYNGAFMLPEMIITMLATPGVVTAIEKIKSR